MQNSERGLIMNKMLKKESKSLFSKLKKSNNDQELQHENFKKKMNKIKYTNSVMNGLHTSICETVFNLANIIFDTRINYLKDNPIILKGYIEVLKNIDALCDENTINSIFSSIEDFDFKFIRNDSEVYCIIKMKDSNDIFAIMQCTNNFMQYKSLSNLLNAKNVYNKNYLENFIYKHICGIILGYTRVSISRFPLSEVEMSYVIKEYPDEPELVIFNDWMCQFNCSNMVQEV